MSNKKSYKKTEEPLIKNMVDIRYDYTHISEGEVIGICMVAICLGIMLPGLIALTIATTGFMFLVPLFIIIAVFSCLPFGLIVPNYRYRKQKRKQAENIFANGTLVIGDIVSLNTTEIGNNSTGQKTLVIILNTKIRSMAKPLKSLLLRLLGTRCILGKKTCH